MVSSIWTEERSDHAAMLSSAEEIVSLRGEEVVLRLRHGERRVSVQYCATTSLLVSPFIDGPRWGGMLGIVGGRQGGRRGGGGGEILGHMFLLLLRLCLARCRFTADGRGAACQG